MPIDQACFAGGCFWCIEAAFAELDGVLKVVSGYTDGYLANPSYEEVSAGDTGHTEAVKINFDSNKISYDQLLEVFWSQIDPTDIGGQFADRGSQYRTGIYYYDEAQRRLALKSKELITAKFNKPIATEIKAARDFYPAENHHQCYYKKNPEHYNSYKQNSGRAKFVAENYSSKLSGSIG